jgi:tRNA_anti-like
MNNQNASEVKAKNITLGSVFAWLFGSVVVLAGIVTLFTHPVSGILFLVVAAIILPPAYSAIKSKLHINLSTGLRVVIVIIIFIIIGSTIGRPDTTATVKESNAVAAPVVKAPVQPTIKVTADQLMSDYTANEVSADAKYKNNVIEVSGIVETIGKDIVDTPYIALKTGGQYSISSIQCMFAKSDESALASVSKGERIVLIGSVTGKLGNVILNGCRISK